MNTQTKTKQRNPEKSPIDLTTKHLYILLSVTLCKSGNRTAHWIHVFGRIWDLAVGKERQQETNPKAPESRVRREWNGT